jgi:4-carboxymuconolactone decarboxylase
MSEQRFKPLSLDEMTPEQRCVAQALMDGPRHVVPRPFHPLLRTRPELADRVRLLGDYIRFENTLPPKLSELAILIVAKHWMALFELHIHYRVAREAGLDPAIADAIVEGRRPSSLAADEKVVYEFCSEVLEHKDVSDATFQAAMQRFGERGVIDLASLVGYFSFVSTIINTARLPIPEGSTLQLPIEKKL